MTEPRRRRANGEASRRKILDAAAEIAGERGYDATSINLVSKRSGLPASSIYWHFEDKDALVAAVIDRSFQRWSGVLDGPVAPAGTERDEWLRQMMRRTGASFTEFPDFLRLGLMLVLDQRPDAPTARNKFVEVRELTTKRVRAMFAALYPELDAEQIESLVTLTIALADGFFVARQVEGADVVANFDLMATAIVGVAHSYLEQPKPRSSSR